MVKTRMEPLLNDVAVLEIIAEIPIEYMAMEDIKDLVESLRGFGIIRVATLAFKSDTTFDLSK